MAEDAFSGLVVKEFSSTYTQPKSSVIEAQSASDDNFFETDNCGATLVKAEIKDNHAFGFFELIRKNVGIFAKKRFARYDIAGDIKGVIYGCLSFLVKVHREAG